MRQYSFQSRQPRRGQALLLAVLIMIFAALLSASFITIVSVNLNQTARQTDKNRAAASAKAGVDFINRQLAFSAQGERWRPSGIPAIGSAEFAAYYTPLDRAQGWAGTFAKYPDPLNAQGDNNGPQFLAKVERIAYTLTSANAEFDKAGSLKVTVIGLSPEDPTAYSRTVFYKGGYQNAPIAQNMRVVSNWDFENGVVPVAQAASYTAPTAVLTNIKGNFPDPPFAVMVGDPRSFTTTGKKTRGGVVIARSGNSFTFAHTGNPSDTLSISPGERIELAASIGAPNGLNYNNETRIQPTPTPLPDISPPVRIDDNATNASGGIRVNGGLWLTGKVSASLRVPREAYGSNGVNLLAPATIQASGLFGRELTGSVTDFRVQGLGIATSSNDLLDSSSTTFPGGWTPQNGYDRRSKDQYVSDAWNRLGGVPSGVATSPAANSSGTRLVRDFVPPAIDKGDGLERYRNLTRFSPPAIPTATNANASLYGEGQGIYVDNVQDKERIYVVNEDINSNRVLDTGEDVNFDGFLETATGFRDMRQPELVNMWLSRPVASAPLINYMRMGVPVPIANSTTASLEQQHVRGWVGPDEFRARGAEIVLGNNAAFANNNINSALFNPTGAFVTITRDSRDDGSAANVLGGVLAKTWKDSSTGANQAGIYTRTFAWPQNGVIAAEGNVRIRGAAIDPPRSLTVVSINNIYIEGSLQILPPSVPPPAYVNKKILLLATKNVVMNPTRVLGRPDTQTTVTAASTTFTVNTDADLDVATSAEFQAGDFVRASNAATGITEGEGYVRSIVDANTLKITPTTAGLVTANSYLRTPNTLPQSIFFDPALGPASRRVATSAITSATDVMQRRLMLATAPSTNFRLASDHQGRRVTAFTASVVAADPANRPTSPVYFSNKGIILAGPPASAPFLDNKASVVTTADKRIRGQFTQPTSGTDEFPDATVFATLTSEPVAQGQNLGVIKTAMDQKFHPDALTGWNYQTTIATPAIPANPPFTGLPFFYLAGVGNRYDFAATSAEGRKDINPATNPRLPSGYAVPFANTISVFANGVQSLLYNETYNNTTIPTRYDRASQFGFNPNYLASEEDILTGDQGFYQTAAGRSTPDSRQLLDANQLSTLVAGLNSISFRQSALTVPLPTGNDYPDYRLLGLKTEEVGLTNASGAVTLDTIQPSHTFTVNAFVYAQNGSWFVIPSGLFNDRLKTIPVGTALTPTITFLDIDDDGVADTGEYIAAGTTGNPFTNGYADLNRNGIIEDTERYAMERYSRFNYSINFNGAIAEKQTPLVNSMRGGNGSSTAAIVANGAVEAWMNSWSTVKKDAGIDPIKDRMTYTFDDDYAIGLLEDDSGFRVPQTTEIFSVS